MSLVPRTHVKSQSWWHTLVILVMMTWKAGTGRFLKAFQPARLA